MAVWGDTSDMNALRPSQRLSSSRAPAAVEFDDSDLEEDMRVLGIGAADHG
ncbi:MAG: hypothetical protein HZT43_08380 [Exiguobacterium profundum]|nr:MAG: hypothetical protein HZT43_08380 [Exiguobacterium profundum]